MNEYNRGWCTKILNDLIRMPISQPFRLPVNPSLDNAPDYFEKIKKPMDLSKVKQNLNAGLYKTPQEFVDDLKLILNNAREYNGPSIFTDITDVIEQWIDEQYSNKCDSYDTEWTQNLDRIVKRLRKHIENAPKGAHIVLDALSLKAVKDKASTSDTDY